MNAAAFVAVVAAAAEDVAIVAANKYDVGGVAVAAVEDARRMAIRDDACDKWRHLRALQLLGWRLDATPSAVDEMA